MIISQSYENTKDRKLELVKNGKIIIIPNNKFIISSE